MEHLLNLKKNGFLNLLKTQQTRFSSRNFFEILVKFSTSTRSSGKVNFIKSTILSKTIKSRSLKEMQKDQDLWIKTLRERKVIEETPKEMINRRSVSRELNHEIEKSEESKLSRDSLYDSRFRKDINKISKVEEQILTLKKGLKLFGVLLLVTIFLFLFSLFLMNRKISALQARIDFLENSKN